MKEVTVFEVEGIFCPKCVKKLQETVGELAGVEKLTVSDDYKQVTVEYTENSINKATIKAAIEATPDKEFHVISC